MKRYRRHGCARCHSSPTAGGQCWNLKTYLCFCRHVFHHFPTSRHHHPAPRGQTFNLIPPAMLRHMRVAPPSHPQNGPMPSQPMQPMQPMQQQQPMQPSMTAGQALKNVFCIPLVKLNWFYDYDLIWLCI